MTMKIYIVTTGGNDYDDCRVTHGLFSTEDKAEQYIANAKASEFFYPQNDFNEIGEIEVDSGLAEADHKTWWCGIAVDNGEIVEPPGKFGAAGYFGQVRQSGIRQVDRIPCYKDRIVIRVESLESAAHAKRLAVSSRERELRLPVQPTKKPGV